MSDDRHVSRKIIHYILEEIPENYIKCPDCEGEGEILFSYNDPGPNTYYTCILCQGLGYVEKAYLEHREKMLKEVTPADSGRIGE